MRTLFGGLAEALAFFDEVPRELLFDQMKAVITKDLRLLGGQLVRNEEFQRFAAHWEVAVPLGPHPPGGALLRHSGQ